MHRFAWLALAALLLGCGDLPPRPANAHTQNGSAPAPPALAETAPREATIAPADTAEATPIVGKVVSIADGDTLTVLDASNAQHKIRLQGIDCPEIGQPFGTRAREALAESCFQQTAEVNWSERDRYQRILGDIHAGGRWINRELVAEGWAWHYRQYSNDPALAEAEATARAARRGLWTDANPIPPWDWRRGVRETASVDDPERRTEAGPRKPVDPRQPDVGTSSEALVFAQSLQQRHAELRPQIQSVTVYVTRTGAKYHAVGCPYLRKSSSAISLEAAQARYSACSVCRGGGNSRAQPTTWATPRLDRDTLEWSVPGTANGQRAEAIVFKHRGDWRLRSLAVGGASIVRDDRTPSPTATAAQAANREPEPEQPRATEQDHAELEQKAAGHLRLAKKLLDGGNETAARKWLQETADDYPGTKAAAEAKQLLLAL